MKEIEIESQWDNIWDVYPEEMSSYKEYLTKKEGVGSFQWAGIRGLKDPHNPLCFDMEFCIDLPPANGIVEVWVQGDKVYKGAMTKKSGDYFRLSDDELVEIESIARKSDDPFVHTVCDQVTLRLVDRLIQKLEGNDTVRDESDPRWVLGTNIDGTLHDEL